MVANLDDHVDVERAGNVPEQPIVRISKVVERMSAMAVGQVVHLVYLLTQTGEVQVVKLRFLMMDDDVLVYSGFLLNLGFLIMDDVVHLQFLVNLAGVVETV